MRPGSEERARWEEYSVAGFEANGQDLSEGALREWPLSHRLPSNEE